jgi:hypothetical protein
MTASVRSIIIAAMLGPSIGCTSFRPVAVVTAAPQAPPQWHVSPGDRVRITRAGTQTSFTVKAVDATAITAENGTRHELVGIDAVERREFSGGKTTVLVAIIAACLFLPR